MNTKSNRPRNIYNKERERERERKVAISVVIITAGNSSCEIKVSSKVSIPMAVCPCSPPADTGTIDADENFV